MVCAVCCMIDLCILWFVLLESVLFVLGKNVSKRIYVLMKRIFSKFFDNRLLDSSLKIVHLTRFSMIGV